MARSSSNVIDSPLKPGETDLLGVAPHVKSLVKFISSAQMPTTLAIQGEWGSGKTSLMNQIRYHLCEIQDSPNADDKEKPYYGIWLNTWQYSLMKSQDETLLAIIQGITEEVIGIMEKRHPNVMKSNLAAVRSMFGKFVKVGAKVAVGAAGLDASIVDDAFASNGHSAQASPLAFRKALSDAIKKCLEEDAKAGNHNRGFLFFIDDLDRLDPAVAVNILELLKNLFEVDNCIFILAIDYDVVVKGLVPKFGPLTDKNEREFRSFFDKIIQLPFSMPMNTYRIDTYLEDSLSNIGYFTKEEMQEIIEEHKITLITLLTKMVRLSTGTNPRSIKRLINTLSLILIMNAINTDEDSEFTNTSASESSIASEVAMSEEEADVPLTINDKLLTFGLVCLQIAYPTIYNILSANPDIKSWDEKTATQFRLKPLDTETVEKLKTQKEFDEEWEQVLYRKCMLDNYLSSYAVSISNLINTILENIPKNAHAESTIAHLLGMASVTTVNSSETSLNIDQKQAKRFNETDMLELFERLHSQQGVRKDMTDLAHELLKKLMNIYGELISVGVTKHHISVSVSNQKTGTRILLIIQPYEDEDDYGVFVKSKAFGVEEGVAIDCLDEPNGDYEACLTDKSREQIRRYFNRISSVYMAKPIA